MTDTPHTVPGSIARSNTNEGRAQSGPFDRSNRGLVEALAEVIADLFVSSQYVYVVVLHAGWMLLLGIALYDTNGTARSIAELFFDAFAALGGQETDGRSGVTEILQVYATLCLMVWSVRVLLRTVRPGLQPWHPLLTVLLSTAIGVTGYSAALAPWHAAKIPSSGIALSLGFFVAIFSLWAATVGRLTDYVLRVHLQSLLDTLARKLAPRRRD